MSKDGFYDSREWREVRYEAIKSNNGKCELCGRGKHDGVMLHVDHIKPRSKAPHLALDPSNLQVLCEDCNLGKGNRCDVDWREQPARAEIPPGYAHLPTIRLSTVVEKLKQTNYADLDEDNKAAMRELLHQKLQRDQARGYRI